MARAMNTARTPLALYIHWPFCVSKCPYCDFNSHVRESVDQDAWRSAMLADLHYEADLLPGREVTSIFFGGGTPSLMPPATVAALIEAADARWGLSEGCEITLEANPSSVEAARFGDIAKAGVNRVSLGLQALDNDALAFLGRAHDVDEGLAALDTAQAAFERVSFDLIYARPGQNLAEWDAELARALRFGTEHLSLYQLTIEPGTRFATLAAKGELTLPDEDIAAELYEHTRAVAASAGLPAYEVSNHARPGAESRHNLTYWRYQDYAGIGPGAHGRRTAHETARHKKPENWLNAVSRNGHGAQIDQPLSPRNRATEALVMGLRLDEGIDLDRVAALGEAEIGALIDLSQLAMLEREGLAIRIGAHLTITERGMPVLEAILRTLVRAEAPVSA